MILRYLHRPHRARQIAAGAHPVPQPVEVVPLRFSEPVDADGVHARRSAVGLDPHPRLMNEALIDLERLHLRLRSNHRLLPVRGDLRSIWPARLLRSSSITGPSPLLRAGPPLCLASVLCPLRFRPLGVLPLATRYRQTTPVSSGRRYRGDRFSCSMPAPATSSRHLYTGRRQGSTQPAPWLRARPTGGPVSRRYPQPPVSAPSFYVSMRLQWFIHVRLLVAYLTRCSGPFPQSLPTPALNRHDTAAVWVLRLLGEPGGPTSITGTARFVLGTSYILITSLSGHTWVA